MKIETLYSLLRGICQTLWNIEVNVNGSPDFNVSVQYGPKDENGIETARVNIETTPPKKDR